LKDFFDAYGPTLVETIQFLIQAKEDLLHVQNALEDIIPDI